MNESHAGVVANDIFCVLLCALVLQLQYLLYNVPRTTVLRMWSYMHISTDLFVSGLNSLLVCKQGFKRTLSASSSVAVCSQLKNAHKDEFASSRKQLSDQVVDELSKEFGQRLLSSVYGLQWDKFQPVAAEMGLRLEGDISELKRRLEEVPTKLTGASKRVFAKEPV